MGQSWVTTTADAVAEWAAGRGIQADRGGIRILLELADETSGVSDPGEIGSGVLRDILLDAFPAAVTATPEDVPAVLETARLIVDYLHDTGQITADVAARTRVELDEVEPEFAQAVADTDAATNAAELFFAMMRDEGVDPADETAVRAWIDAFQQLSDEEQAARTLPYLQELVEDDDAVVQPVRLAARADLAAAARVSELLTQAVALADTDDTDDEDDERGSRERLRHGMRAAGLDTEQGRAAVRGDDEDALLAVWIRLLDDVVTLDVPEPDDEPDEERQLTAVEAVRDALPGVLLHVYEQEHPPTRAELVRAVTEHLLGAFEVTGKAAREWREAGEHALDQELADLTRWGVLDGGPDGYELTPLGTWSVRELLLADGYVAPLVGDLADSPAADLVAGLTLHRADTADEEMDLWLGRREAAAAADELLALMAAGSPGTRNLAAVVLHRVGAEAEPAVRKALDDHQTRPYALLWLGAHGDATAVPTSAETLWIFADTVAGLLETDEPAEAIETALADAPPDTDLQAMIEELWRVDHPDVPEVLDALGDHHPDKAVAKAARRAAFKARSAPGSP